MKILRSGKGSGRQGGRLPAVCGGNSVLNLRFPVRGTRIRKVAQPDQVQHISQQTSSMFR